jgi:hypothetical protein
MGNRAVIILQDHAPTTDAALYLHWNGGPESVYAFLEHLRLSRAMGHSADYTAARLCQTIGNFLGGTTSLGVVRCPVDLEDLQQAAPFFSQGDNGIYLVRLSRGSYAMAGRYVHGAWLDAEEVERERREAFASARHGALLAEVTRANAAAFPPSVPAGQQAAG